MPKVVNNSLAAGDVIVAPLPNGRHGAIWVLGAEDGACTFVVLDGFWDAAPTSRDVPLRPMEPLHRSPVLGPEVWKGWFRGRLPADFATLRRVALPAAIRRHDVAEGTMVFQHAEHFRATLHDRWRWEHDRDAVMRERNAKPAAPKAAGKPNSLAKMLRERPFAHWREHWPARAVTSVRAAFRAATAELIALGAAAPRRAKTAVFRRLVEALDEIYAREACIETGEATELVERIEALAALVGLNNRDERLTRTRAW